MFLSDPGGLPLISIIVIIIHGHKELGSGARFGSKFQDRDVFKKVVTLNNTARGIKKCPSAKLDRRGRRITGEKIFWSARSSKILHMSLEEETARASLFS